MTKSNRPTSATPSFLSGEQRINKLLAAAGFGSRRQVDELITDGRVEIDGKLVTQVGVKVDADVAKITVDGEPLKRHKPVYFAVHKPEGFLCTNCDPDGRPRVIELVPTTARLFPVGRLDASSTGLILLTNDGELAQRLAHPKHCVPKTYFVVVAGQVDYDSMKRLQRGIYLAEGVARVDGASIRKVRKGCTEIDITLSEGKNREIRRVLARLGHKVVVLRRVAIGPLKLADMPEGSYRPLMDKEVAALYKAVDDIKRARNQDRRERKKRNTIDSLGSSESSSGSPSRKPQRQPVPIFDEEGDNWDEADDDELIESLPPMSSNPFRTEDDEDEDESFDDAILVTETDGQIYSNRKGAVLAFDEDDLEVESIVEDVEQTDDRRKPNRDRSQREPRESGRATRAYRPAGEGRSPREDRGPRRSSTPRTEGSERPSRGRRVEGGSSAGAAGYAKRPFGNRTSGSRPTSQRSRPARTSEDNASQGSESPIESQPARGRMRRTGAHSGNAGRSSEGNSRPRSGARMGGPRSSSTERSSSPRAAGGRASSTGGARASTPRSGSARPTGARSSSARSGASSRPASGSPRPGGARPMSAGRPRRSGKPGGGKPGGGRPGGRSR